MDQPDADATSAGTRRAARSRSAIDPQAVFEPHATSEDPDDAKPILEVEDLRMYFPVKSGRADPAHGRARPGGRRRLLRGPDGRLRSGWSASPAAASRRPAG